MTYFKEKFPLSRCPSCTLGLGIGNDPGWAHSRSTREDLQRLTPDVLSRRVCKPKTRKETVVIQYVSSGCCSFSILSDRLVRPALLHIFINTCGSRITITSTFAVHWASDSYSIKVQTTDAIPYCTRATFEVTPIHLRSGTSPTRRPMIRISSKAIPFWQHKVLCFLSIY